MRVNQIRQSQNMPKTLTFSERTGKEIKDDTEKVCNYSDDKPYIPNNEKYNYNDKIHL